MQNVKSSLYNTCNNENNKKSPAYLCLNGVTPALGVQGFHSHLYVIVWLFFHTVCINLENNNNQAES